MKATNQIIARLAIGCVLALSQPLTLPAQLQFTEIRATEEQAIQLHWESEPNTIYRIEHAEELSDISNGGTSWRILCERYASHGTNTLWLDTGNYNNEPPILHPKKTGTRFYRIFNEGTNTAPAPTVAINSPANGNSVAGHLSVTVTASSDQATLGTSLYVDGEKMPFARNSTNYFIGSTNHLTETYVINTCEWPNGVHKLFAVANCTSEFPGDPEGNPVNYGHGFSGYVPVNFSNLITRFSFSEPFFEPDAGQTQQVGAVFAANVNWTLQIQNEASDTVRTVTGNGATMKYDWDGTGEGGTILPAGTYTYLLSVQTNGQSLMMASNDDSSSSLDLLTITGATSPSESSGENWHPTSIKEALAAGLTSYFVKPPPLPLVPVKTNGKLQFMLWEEIHGPQPPIEVQISPSVQDKFLAALVGKNSSNTGFENTSTEATYEGPQSQSTRGPERPPTAPVVHLSGTFGVAYQQYLPNGISLLPPTRGVPGVPSLRIEMQGWPGNHVFNLNSLGGSSVMFDGFIEEMKKSGWKPAFAKKDAELQPSDLKKASLGGANIFNQANLGVLTLHGLYGTGQDYTANLCEQIYFPLQDNSWVRMSEMDFGSAGPNGLRWMALFACNSLRQANWNSMRSKGITPFNNNLHLLLGTDSLVWSNQKLLAFWVQSMRGIPEQVAPDTVMNAWFNAGTDAYAGKNFTNAIRFAVAGYNNCKPDTLRTNYTPGGGIFYESRQIFTP